MAFETTVEVRWSDMDSLGHVNNATYFTFLENARVEWLNHFGERLQGVGPVVITAQATYLKPVIYPATITLKLSVSHIGRTSLTLFYELFQEDTLMTTAETKLVWVDYQDGTSCPIPDAFRAHLEPTENA